jgi:hypothetical protein
MFVIARSYRYVSSSAVRGADRPQFRLDGTADLPALSHPASRIAVSAGLAPNSEWSGGSGPLIGHHSFELIEGRWHAHLRCRQIRVVQQFNSCSELTTQTLRPSMDASNGDRSRDRAGHLASCRDYSCPRANGLRARPNQDDPRQRFINLQATLSQSAIAEYGHAHSWLAHLRWCGSRGFRRSETSWHRARATSFVHQVRA